MKRLYAYITVFLVVFLAASPAGCDGGETPADETPIELDGSQWSLYSIDGNELVEGSYISIYFRDGSFWGSAGCNIYGGDYSIKAPDVFIVSGGSVTDMDCSSPEGVIEQESAYIDAIFDAAFCCIVDGRLEIGDSTNQHLLVFDRIPEYLMDPADLVGTSWILVSMDGDEVTEELSITLVFEGNGIATGRAGCFNYELSYSASGDDIRWGMSTRRDGELSPELEIEALQYTDSIMWGANYRLTEGQLEIFTARGETLVFESLGG